MKNIKQLCLWAFIFFIVFGQFALFRARRYRLTRTIWRGVRFWMTGSGWNYAFRWLGWGCLAAPVMLILAARIDSDEVRISAAVCIEVSL